MPVAGGSSVPLQQPAADRPRRLPGTCLRFRDCRSTAAVACYISGRARKQTGSICSPDAHECGITSSSTCKMPGQMREKALLVQQGLFFSASLTNFAGRIRKTGFAPRAFVSQQRRCRRRRGAPHVLLLQDARLCSSFSGANRGPFAERRMRTFRTCAKNHLAGV